MSEYDELLPAFVEESRQHLQTIEPDILTLEQGGTAIDREVVNRIFRGIHSIKGASGFFGLQKIGTLSHVIENLLSHLRDGHITPQAPMIDTLLKGVDTLRAMIDDITGSEQVDISQETTQLQGFLNNVSEPWRTVTVVEKKPAPDISHQGPAPDNTHQTHPRSSAFIRGSHQGPPPDTHQEADHPGMEVEAGKFDISENDIRQLISQGLHLYAVKIFLNKDLRQKNKTPFDLIYSMESMGQYVDSFLDIRSVSGLSDCLDNDLAFDFLFSTNLEPHKVAKGLGLPKKRITAIDLDEFRTGASAREPEHERERELGRSRADVRSSDAGQQTTDNGQRAIQTEEKIRVRVSFLNDLVNLAGELVLGRNQLMQAALPLVRHTPGLNPVLQHISRVTSEMQEKIMRMRMQPISVIFGKFQRIVRTLARSHHKEVRLVTHGEDVELDKSIIEGLSDPLTHLIRNAVDHAIELPDERERLGKPRHGTIELSACHQGGQVHLMVSDDGIGVDGRFVAEKALEKGMIRHDQLAAMSERDRVRLILRPGFSTVDQITDLSGRGVGMDVVITNIEHLGGTVEIDTKVGRGTRLTLMLPLTLAIVSGLLIQAEDQFFILPEVDIVELVRVKPDEIETRVNIVHDAHLLRLREMLLPLIHLNQALGLGVLRHAQEPVLRHAQEPLRILVIKHGASRFGLIVDRIESTEEIVVKPLPRYLKKMRTFSGVSILGNGMVGLILDVAGILRNASIRQVEESADEIPSDVGEIAVEAEMQTFLLFDNNTEERFAVPLELISRIERVSAKEIEHVKDRQYLQYHGKKLRLIFLEDHLPVQRPERTGDTIGLIVPKQTHPLGIVMSRVINTINAVVDLDTSTIMAPGLFGSAVLDGRITLLPDMYRIFEMAAPEWYDPKGAGSTCAMGRCRILLADDTPFFRMVEKDYLTSAGYDILLAEDGKKALQVLEEEVVDAVILDIVMPRMDGWQTIRAIRADERLRDLPVMAVTSLEDEALAAKGRRAGFNEWELKLNKTRLLEKLAAMLGV